MLDKTFVLNFCKKNINSTDHRFQAKWHQSSAHVSFPHQMALACMLEKWKWIEFKFQAVTTDSLFSDGSPPNTGLKDWSSPKTSGQQMALSSCQIFSCVVCVVKRVTKGNSSSRDIHLVWSLWFCKIDASLQSSGTKPCPAEFSLLVVLGRRNAGSGTGAKPGKLTFSNCMVPKNGAKFTGLRCWQFGAI